MISIFTKQLLQIHLVKFTTSFDLNGFTDATTQLFYWNSKPGVLNPY